MINTAIKDWRLFFSIGFCLPMMMLAIVVSNQTNTVTYLRAERTDTRKAQDKKDAAASIERQRILKGQEDLKHRYDLLINYLQETGQLGDIPPDILDGTSTGSRGSITIRRSGGDSGGSTSRRKSSSSGARSGSTEGGGTGNQSGSKSHGHTTNSKGGSSGNSNAPSNSHTKSKSTGGSKSNSKGGRYK